MFFVENTGFRAPGLRDLGRVAGRLRRAARPSVPAARAPEGVEIVSPLVLPPTRAVFRKGNAALFVPRLAAELRRRGLGARPIVFAYLPTATTLELLDLLEPALVVYDCVANFRAHPSAPRDLAATEARLLARSELVLADSRTLREDLAARHPNVLELHHGVSAPFFLPPRAPGPHRRFAYFGTLWRAIDYAAIRALAEAGFEVELIGPAKEHPPRLPASVRARGPVAHAELPRLLAGFDGLLLPYVDDAFTRGVIPAKTYECLATGLPVLASPLPALTALPELDVLLFARAPADWAAAARSLDAREDGAARAARVAAARARSEEACFAVLRAAVGAALPRA